MLLLQLLQLLQLPSRQYHLPASRQYHRTTRMGRTESLPPACDYVCAWQRGATVDAAAAAAAPVDHAVPSPASEPRSWRLLELSDADGDVFDLSFVFDQNWWVQPDRLPALADSPPRAVSRRDCCAGLLQDSFELHDVLSRAECDAIVRLSDAIGFQRPKCGGGIGSKETSPPPDRLVWVTEQAWCNRVFRRLEACLPNFIMGRQPVGINPRWRLYRYEPGFALERHQDRSFKASGADDAGELRYDVLRDGSESLLTLLIYLNEGMQGGGTMLYERDDAGSALQEVSPQPGSALLFPHGRDNPDSVWHAGMPVIGGCKYIIRTDVIYGPATPAPTPTASNSGKCNGKGNAASVGDVDASSISCETDARGESGNSITGRSDDATDAGAAAAAALATPDAWDESSARMAFRHVDEYEMGWIDMKGVIEGLAQCGYPAATIAAGKDKGSDGDGAHTHTQAQASLSVQRVDELLSRMADEREDTDCLNVDEFCRLCRMVHEDTCGS